jgi:hypothetical protein
MMIVLIPIALFLLLGLPLAGILLARGDLLHYTEFPPLTRYVEHAPFAWPAFLGLAVLIAIVLLPFLFRILSSRLPPSVSRLPPSASRFPLWGWAGLALGMGAWVLAWTRFAWFAPLQAFTFSPLWLAYIVVINALTFRRTGRCMLKDRPLYLLKLFVLSAAFWWFFEYLNRFVQNWYYEGIGSLTPGEYFVFATLPFSTVLPAVLGTYDLLASYPRLSAGLADFIVIRPRRPRLIAGLMLVAACAGLTGIGIWPDLLFPLLWLAPLIILTSLQGLCGPSTLFADVSRGDWRRLWLLALSALICGFFWEMWNYYSLAKWIYAVPYVNRFKIFEMPILGYIGYLPFGLECAAVAAWAETQFKPPRRWGALILALLAAAAIWLPILHVPFSPDLATFRVPAGISPAAHALAARHLTAWSSPDLRDPETQTMRSSNPEWDFMERTFLVLSLANMSLRDPLLAPKYLPVMDRIIDDTIRIEQEQGKYHFLMNYAQAGHFRSTTGRSMFEDGEIALMLAARRLIEDDPERRRLLRERVDLMVKTMSESPVLSGESYPDECWTFCNAVGLSAIRIADLLDQTDHGPLIQRWLETARRKLVDQSTGMLVSSYSFSGEPYDGPEGSSIWMVAHCLQILDPEWATDQYARARRELGKTLLGFGYAREWPSSWQGPADVDSGPIVPILGASAGSSGLALLGAAAFGDNTFLSALLTSLNYGAFPEQKNGQLRFRASNAVGDAVLLYACVLGPAWEKVHALEALATQGQP